ncbi:sporulation protein YqfC [Clostridium ganghwense]|uniref:Sporulation protein YqfC n=2 Tax=Clostridium ganghwense TaxID=312089 RepID=A0ABT4CRZ8_9CLOT|nr:sporulation protein YqfC [Clostridium ganghwense]MCY6371817.1 sporulation protein YqfC [Clostridium ganghwense]
MKEKFDMTKENVAQKLDLPRDVVLNIPKITITGNNEIIIENHKGIIIFEEKEIKINSNVGVISIKGEGLEILFIGGSTIILGGKFKGVIYEGIGL